MKTSTALIILAILYLFVSTLDYWYIVEVVPCTTDTECQQLNPHLGDY